MKDDDMVQTSPTPYGPGDKPKPKPEHFDREHRCAKADLLLYSLGLTTGVMLRVKGMLNGVPNTKEAVAVLDEHAQQVWEWVRQLRVYEETK